MSTRTKLGRTQHFLAELKWSIENTLYAKQTGGIKLLQITDMLVDETYDGAHDKETAAVLWDSIDKIKDNYKGPHAEAVHNNLNNTNIKV